MSGVVPASSDDCSRVLNPVEPANGSCSMLTLIFGLAFSKRATPFVRNDFDGATPSEPAARGSFQIVIVVVLLLAPAAEKVSNDAPEITVAARLIRTRSLRRDVRPGLEKTRNIRPPAL